MFIIGSTILKKYKLCVRCKSKNMMFVKDQTDHVLDIKHKICYDNLVDLFDSDLNNCPRYNLDLGKYDVLFEFDTIAELAEHYPEYQI